MTDGQILSRRLGAVLFVALLVVWIPAVSMSVVADTTPSGPAADDSPTVEDSTNTSEATEETAQAQLTLARDVQTILEDESRSNREAALGVTDMALAKRQSQANVRQIDTGMASPLGTQRTNVRGARELLNIIEGTESSENSKSVRLAESGVKLQVAQFSQSERPIAPSEVDLPDVETPDHESPSAALFSLLGRNSSSLTAVEANDIQSLDDLPEPIRSEFTDTIDAYIAYHSATKEFSAQLNSSQLGGISQDRTHTQWANHDIEDNTRKVRVAQIQLLKESNDLDIALNKQEPPGIATPSSHTQPCTTLGGGGSCSVNISTNGVGFLINFSTHDSTYTKNYNLLIDRGGNDEYDNNAGGSQGFANASALIDLNGNDTYLGKNGGANGFGSAGFLFDVRGDDDYLAGGLSGTGGFGTNGGATQLGTGFLVDVAGSDYYDAGSNGTNGGGRFVGTGFLLDAGTQKDRYNASYDAVNGGARFQGAGMLIDVGGMGGGDQYNTTGDADYKIGADPGGGIQGGNGGGTNGGIAFLLDAGTQGDTYDGGSNATNGGGRFVGVGFLLDVGGDDDYKADPEITRSVDGVNGGGWSGGVGTLIDVGGADEYNVTSDSRSIHGVNGGSSGLPRSGTVVGSAKTEPAIGMLIDVGESADEYLVDGDDEVRGANGGGHHVGKGMLIDEKGKGDLYKATSTNATTDAVNGGAPGGIPPSLPLPIPGSGLLLDSGGNLDEYVDGRCGTQTDDTVVPKGFAGAQIDSKSAGEPQKYGCGNNLPGDPL